MTYHDPVALRGIAQALFAIAVVVPAVALAQPSYRPATAPTHGPIPILEIDLAADAIPDDPKALTRMRLLYDRDGDGYGDAAAPGPQDGEYVGPVAIETRGSSSLRLFPKVGYGLELRGVDGADTSASLLGMPPEEDWVLHGPYSDKTLIRNAFSYQLAEGLPGYAPRARFVELRLGGEYWGLYLLTERLKRDKRRIDVKKLEPADSAGVALTGGYILKTDNVTGDATAFVNGFNTRYLGLPGRQGTAVRFHYPRPRDITPAQRAYIERWMLDFEAALAGDDYGDPDVGYAAYIDVGSFVDYFLLTELTRNIDGYFVSTYYYKERDDRGGKLHMGPIWDMNLALANGAWHNARQPEGWVFSPTYPELSGTNYRPFWWLRLFRHEPFRQRLDARWRELRSPGAPFSDERFWGLYDSLATLTGGAVAARNFERWPVLGESTWGNHRAAASQEDELAYVREYMTTRIAWLDEQFGYVSSAREVGRATTRTLVYPNPVTVGETVRLRGLPPGAAVASVTVYDQVGRAVARERDVDAAALSAPPQPGVHYYRIVLADGAVLHTTVVAIE